jgi:predicted nucleic acid-binding protein
MNGNYFIDTNVLIYSLDPASAPKQQRARALVTDGSTSKLGIVSFQVVQEFVNVALKKFQTVGTPGDIAAFLQGVLFPMMAVPSSPWLFRDALRLGEENQIAWFDSLIVAAAIQSRCKILYSEDLEDGRRFGDVVVENPFH